MRNKIVVLSKKTGSIEFDKDEIIGMIPDFDEFEREGLSLAHVCAQAIANEMGVDASDVYVRKIDFNYRDNTKYRANYIVCYSYNENELIDAIKEYVGRFDVTMMACAILPEENETINVALTLLYDKSVTKDTLEHTGSAGIQKMLCDMYPNYKFVVQENIKMNF